MLYGLTGVCWQHISHGKSTVPALVKFKQVNARHDSSCVGSLPVAGCYMLFAVVSYPTWIGT